MKPALHIMVDLETLGLTPGCSIIQIAAVASYRGMILDTMSEVISTDSNRFFGLVSESGTLDWWAKQDADLRNKVFSGTTELHAALSKFGEFLMANLNKLPASSPVMLWAKPARFDFPILEEAYKKVNSRGYDIKVPYHHSAVMDARTLFKLHKYSQPEPEFIGTKHDALADAMHQMLHLNNILECNYEHNW